MGERDGRIQNDLNVRITRPGTALLVPPRLTNWLAHAGLPVAMGTGILLGIVATTYLAIRLFSLSQDHGATLRAIEASRREVTASRASFERLLFVGDDTSRGYRASIDRAKAAADWTAQDGSSTETRATARDLQVALAGASTVMQQVDDLFAQEQDEAAYSLWTSDGQAKLALAEALDDRLIASAANDELEQSQEASALTRYLLIVLIATATAAGLACGQIGHWLRSIEMASPMISLLASVERAGHGDFSTPIDPAPRGEFRQLSQGIEWLRRTLRDQSQRLTQRMRELEESRLDLENAALERGRAYHQETQRRQELASLVQTTALITAQLQTEALLQLVVREAVIAFGCRYGCVWLIEPRDDRLVLGVSYGTGPSSKDAITCTFSDLGLNERSDSARPYLWTPPLAVARHFAHQTAGDTPQREALMAPLAIGGNRIGILHLAQLEDRPFTAHEVELAQAFAAHTAVAMENARLYAALDEERQLIRALAETSAALNSTQDLMRLMPLTLDRLNLMPDMQAESTAVALFDQSRQLFAVVASRGIGEARLRTLEIPLSEFSPPQRTQLLNNREPFLGDEEEHIPLSLQVLLASPSPGAHRYLTLVPLVWQTEVLGILILFGSRRIEVTGARLAALTTFSDHAAIATKNAEVFAAERASVARLEQSNRARVEFTSMVSHELKNPLAMLHNYATLLLNYSGQLSGDQRDVYLRTIHKESGQLIHLVRDILDVSRIDTELFDYNMQPCDLAALVLEVCREFETVSAAHRLSWHLDGGAVLIVDPFRMKQVLVNILDNAVKYSPDGGEIVVRTFLSNDAQRMFVSISDQGVGMSPEEQTRLFQRFSRVRNEQTASIGGTGLGLYICAKILEAHRGDYQVSSSAGGGTTLSFSLPLAAGPMKMEVPTK